MMMTLSIGDDYFDVQISLYSARKKCKRVCAHEINFHEINSNVFNSYKNKSILIKSTLSCVPKVDRY